MRKFSDACERNKDPILTTLREVLTTTRTVLEIGSGTGQHAVHFASALPYITWQTSDLTVNHETINSWISESSLKNVRKPIRLDVNMEKWPLQSAEAVFTANTLHVISWPSVKNMFEGVSKVLSENGVFCIYGPFKYRGKHISKSNELFDASIQTRFPGGGIRNYEDLLIVADTCQLKISDEFEMPSNNSLLVFAKKHFES